MRFFYNINIPYGVRRGRKNINVQKGVRLVEQVQKKEGVPTIGDSVFFGINSTIVGDIYIGNDILIASNISLNFDVHDYYIIIENLGIIHYKENATEGYNNFKIKGV